MRGLEQIPWLYDALLSAQELRGLARWRRWLAGGALGRTLDLGCGTGRNLVFFAPGVHAVGLDPSALHLARARRRAPRVPLVRAVAEALPFRDGTFDTVVCGLVLCSVADPALALSEIRRVLAHGGAVRAMEHVRSRSPFWGRVQDWLQPAWTWAAGSCHPNRETERSVEAAGFAIEPDGRRHRGVMRRFRARLRPGA